MNETTKDETQRTAKRRNELSIGDGKKSSIHSPSRERRNSRKKKKKKKKAKGSIRGKRQSVNTLLYCTRV